LKSIPFSILPRIIPQRYGVISVFLNGKPRIPKTKKGGEAPSLNPFFDFWKIMLNFGCESGATGRCLIS
jgi:hypothetical protein